MRDLSDTEIAQLQAQLDVLADAAPALAPLDASAIDGYLCGVLLQPQPVPESAWWPWLLDGEGRPARSAAAQAAADAIASLARQRHAWLDERIGARQWFDPWLFASDDEAAPVRESTLPWAAGFAHALDKFPALSRLPPQALAEPLALIYLHFDPEELEFGAHEEALAAALEALEPPADLTEASEDLVSAVLLLADVGRPLFNEAAPRTELARANRGPAPRSKSARPARARRG